MISDAGFEKLNECGGTNITPDTLISRYTINGGVHAARAAEELAYATQELFKVIEFRIDDPRCKLYDVAKVALERYLNRKI